MPSHRLLAVLLLGAGCAAPETYRHPSAALRYAPATRTLTVYRLDGAIETWRPLTRRQLAPYLRGAQLEAPSTARRTLLAGPFELPSAAKKSPGPDRPVFTGQNSQFTPLPSPCEKPFSHAEKPPASADGFAPLLPVTCPSCGRTFGVDEAP